MLLTKTQIKKIFEKSQVTMKDMKAVASSPKLKSFDSINLSGKGITDKIGLVLINSKYIFNLATLDLSENNLTNDFANVLVESTKTLQLKDPQLGSNFIKSSVIPFLVDKFNGTLNENPSDGDNDYVCGIAIYYEGIKWIRLYDAAKQGLIDPRDLYTEEIDDASYESAGGAYYTSLILNKVEDFYWILNEESGDDDLFDNLRDAEAAFEELKVKEEEVEVEAEAEVEVEVEANSRLYDPLKLSEKEEKERTIFINEIEKQCKRRAKKLGLPEVTDKEIAKGIKLEMVLIPAGTFMMGSPTSEEGHRGDEKQHEVTLTKSFYMGKYEVTQEQWEVVMGYNPCTYNKGANLPVANLSWYNCKSFINKLNKRTDGCYRLPTEAEWEYACRGGAKTAYSFGEKITPIDANYRGTKIGKTVIVGSYKPNAFGLYDMHGNVEEFCEDWFLEYTGQAVTDPGKPGTEIYSGIHRVLRGGSFSSYSPGLELRSSRRSYDIPTTEGVSSHGVRLAWSK